MFDLPVDAIYLWTGVGMVSLAVLGVAVSLPSTAPPDATGVARAVDAVAVEPPGARATVELSATELTLGPNRVGVAGPSGRSHAAFAYGPVAVAWHNSTLERVLDGAPLRTVFDSQSRFRRALLGAQTPDPAWRPAPTRLTVRRVSWGEVNGTLVG